MSGALPRLRERIGAGLDRLRRNEAQLELVLSLIIGALVGLVVVAFILLTGRLAARMYPAGGAAWHRLIVPTVGALFSGFLVFRYFPQARGSGIPQTKFALFVGDGLISLRTVLGKFVCCSTSLASGIALGREGPSVHMGAGLASVLGARLGLRTERIKALMPVGCAAALAAAFNTPIAAVLFSLEEVMGDLHAPIIGSVVLGSATAWMVLHLLLGDAPLFHVAAYRLVHPGELLAYAVLGVVGGFGSAAFVKLLLWLRRGFQRLPASTVWLQPVVGGLTVGILGFFVPPVLGVGYDYIERVLNGEIVLGLIVALAILKCVSTAVCYASGNAGGIFGPSLFIGAMMGAAVGAVTHAAFPAMTAAPGAYALVGMGTAFAGIVRTPLTSVIMIFELTRDYSIIVPLMISNLLAFYVSQRLQRVPIYEALALQDGIHLPRHEARGYLSAARVEQVMRPAPALDSGAEQVPIVQPDAHLHPDHSLSIALERLGASGHQQLPVVSRADVRQVLGVVTLDAVLAGFRLRAEDPPAGSGTTPVRRADRHVFVATLATVVAAMAVLAAVDVWLATKERVETSHEAARLFAEGQRLERAGRAEPAADRFRAALAMSRDDRAYQLALARALQTGGRSAEAQDLLADLLRRQPTDGEASLLMARVLAGRGDSAGAEDYYHRAVYGHWPEHAAERQLRARVELVDLLAVRGAREALVAELMPLKALATSHPDVLGDVAEAELALRDYPAAARDFEMAVAAAPQDERLAARLALARRLSAMDPGAPSLRAWDRYARTVALLNLVREEAASCQEAADVVTDTRPVSAHRGAADPRPAADANLERAARLWKATASRCPRTASEDTQELFSRLLAPASS